MDIDKEFEQHIDLPKPHKEYSAEQALRDVIRATEDGEVYVALAFLNGMLTAMTMGANK
jgi:hypothetical protein